MLVQYMKNGEIVKDLPALHEIQKHMRTGLSKLDDTYKRILNPHVYKVSITKQLRKVKYS